MSIFCIPDEVFVHLLAEVDNMGVCSLFLVSKRMNISRRRLLGLVEDDWFTQRTETQLIEQIERAYDPNHSVGIVDQILKPDRRLRLSVVALASVLLQSMKYRRAVANMILPFCECWVRSSDVGMLKTSMRDRSPRSSFVTCVIRVSQAKNLSMEFPSVLVSRGGPGDFDCQQSAIVYEPTQGCAVFWLGTEPQEEGWVAARISMHFQWLTLHCTSIH